MGKDTAPELDAGSSLSRDNPAKGLVTGHMTLNLGVVDIPYGNVEKPKKVAQAKKGKASKPKGPAAGTQTTGDVAQWLENEYDVMQGFADLHDDDIAKLLENSIAGALESLIQGAPPRLDIFGTATSAIETLFKFTYLDGEEIVKTGATGVPTQAAKDGVNHRLKHPYAKANPRRPSFIDTGMYQQSFKAWVD